jgi:hypothetical protein
LGIPNSKNNMFSPFKLENSFPEGEEIIDIKVGCYATFAITEKNKIKKLYGVGINRYSQID